MISTRVKVFTLFDTVKLNDAFLELLNYADGSNKAFPVGNGLCKNACAYSHVVRRERSSEAQPPALNAEEYADYLRRQKARMTSERMWKDDYHSYCIYVQAGKTQVLWMKHYLRLLACALVDALLFNLICV